MPAAAVIPAPRVYTKAVAVKTLVVEFTLSWMNLFQSCLFGLARGWGGEAGMDQEGTKLDFNPQARH